MPLTPTVTKVKPKKSWMAHILSFNILKTSSIPSRDKMFFTEQLALLIETGTSLHDSLQIIKNETQNGAFQVVLEGIIHEVAEGKSFSEALSKHPTVFSKTYTNLVAASEGGGFLHQILLELLAMDQKKEALRNTLISAFTYPIFLLLFSGAVVVFVLVVVFPKFGELFSTIREQLPVTTLFLLWLSETLTRFWPILLGVAVGGSLLFRYWLKSTPGKILWDRFKLSIPFMKSIFIELYIVVSLRVMSLSLSKGVSILDTLSACQETVQNHIFQSFLKDVQKGVEEGKGIAQEFKRSPLIPHLVQQMMTTGETSGTLPRVLSRVADFYEQQLTKRLQFISKIAEPIMLLFMGTLVGVIVSALILPIFMLSRSIR